MHHQVGACTVRSAVSLVCVVVIVFLWRNGFVFFTKGTHEACRERLFGVGIDDWVSASVLRVRRILDA